MTFPRSCAPSHLLPLMTRGTRRPCVPGTFAYVGLPDEETKGSCIEVRCGCLSPHRLAIATAPTPSPLPERGSPGLPVMACREYSPESSRVARWAIETFEGNYVCANYAQATSTQLPPFSHSHRHGSLRTQRTNPAVASSNCSPCESFPLLQTRNILSGQTTATALTLNLGDSEMGRSVPKCTQPMSQCPLSYPKC